MPFKMPNVTDYIKDSLPIGMYEAARRADAIISGPTIISVANNSFIQNLTTTVFVDLNRAEDILVSLRDNVAEYTYEDPEGEHLKVSIPHFTRSSMFARYNIVACYRLNFDGMKTVVYTVNGSLTEALKIQGVDILNTYYMAQREELVVTPTNMRKIKAKKASYSVHGMYMFMYSDHEEAIDENYVYSNNEFLNVDEEFIDNFDITIDENNFNGFDDSMLPHTDKFAVMTILANSIKYFCKYGYSYSEENTSSVMIGMKNDPIKTSLPKELFIPALETYNYYDMSVDNLYNFYKKAVMYDYEGITFPGYIELNGVIYTVTHNKYEDYTRIESETSSEMGYLDYNGMKYSFDYKYYETLSNESDKEKYMKQAFVSHCGYASVFLNNKFGQHTETELRVVQYYEHVLLSELNTMIENCCVHNIEMDEAEYVGITATPDIEEFVDDNDYIDYKKFIENKENNVIFCIMDDRADMEYTEPAQVIATTRMQMYMNYLDMENIVYECTEKFDSRNEPNNPYIPFMLTSRNLKFAQPYYNIMGKVLISIQDFFTVLSTVHTINVFKLYRSKSLDRIAVLDNVGLGVNVLGDGINIVSGFHCQPDTNKPVHRMFFAKVSEFYEVEREEQNVATGPTKEELLTKYPEIRAVVDNPDLTRQQKIIAVNRMQIDGGDKMKMIGYIQSEIVSDEVVVLQPPEQENELYGIMDEIVVDRLYGIVDDVVGEEMENGDSIMAENRDDIRRIIENNTVNGDPNIPEIVDLLRDFIPAEDDIFEEIARRMNSGESNDERVDSIVDMILDTIETLQGGSSEDINVVGLTDEIRENPRNQREVERIIRDYIPEEYADDVVEAVIENMESYEMQASEYRPSNPAPAAEEYTDQDRRIEQLEDTLLQAMNRVDPENADDDYEELNDAILDNVDWFADEEEIIETLNRIMPARYREEVERAIREDIRNHARGLGGARMALNF